MALKIVSFFKLEDAAVQELYSCRLEVTDIFGCEITKKCQPLLGDTTSLDLD